MRKKVTLFADKGMIVTDGENYGTTVDIEINGDDSKYYEITQEEYDTIMAEQERQVEEM